MEELRMADLIERDALLKDMGLTDAVKYGNKDAEQQYRSYSTWMSYEIADSIWDAPAVNRWIPVEDALPEIKEYHISETVLCYCDSGALAIARLEENGFGQVGFNCEKDDEYHHSAGKVLYWMPIPEIPEPPEKEAENE